MVDPHGSAARAVTVAKGRRQGLATSREMRRKQERAVRHTVKATDVGELRPGMRVMFDIGVCTVIRPLTPARRDGRQVGYRVQLAAPNGMRLSPFVANFGRKVDVVEGTK
jgi:hypothetical protein